MSAPEEQRRALLLRRKVRHRFGVLLVALVALVGAGCTPLLGGYRPAATAAGQSHGSASARPVAALGHVGRWFTDATGRVVMLRGMNFVEKFAPFTPAADGFDDDDANLLAANGFNALRLGVPFGFVMPTPGRVDRAYLASIANTVAILGRHHIYVLLDFHQDGWGPVTHGNGMPAWATYTDGLPNPPDPFPTYYVTNPRVAAGVRQLLGQPAGTRRRPPPDLLRVGWPPCPPFRVEPQRHRLRSDERALARHQLVTVPDGLPRPRDAAARAVLRSDDRRGARGRPSSPRLRRAVRALQLRQRRHLAAGDRLRQRAVDARLRAQRAGKRR